MSTTERCGDAVMLALVRELVSDGSARRIRTGAHLSLSDVGRSLGGVAASTVLRWERGSLPRAAMALRYGELLSELACLNLSKEAA